MNKVVLDTDIFSEITKQKNQNVINKAKAYFAIWGYYTISVSTVLEVVKGFHKVKDTVRMQQFFQQLVNYEILPLESDSAKVAGLLYADLESNGKTIGRCDPIIAAIAIHNDLTLVTGNTKHYKRIQELGYPLKLENWKE